MPELILDETRRSILQKLSRGEPVPVKVYALGDYEQDMATRGWRLSPIIPADAVFLKSWRNPLRRCEMFMVTHPTFELVTTYPPEVWIRVETPIDLLKRLISEPVYTSD